MGGTGKGQHGIRNGKNTSGPFRFVNAEGILSWAITAHAIGEDFESGVLVGAALHNMENCLGEKHLTGFSTKTNVKHMIRRGVQGK